MCLCSTVILFFVPHYFYLARCRDGSLYAGTCTDPRAREAKHNDGTGAKYTRSRRPVQIVHCEEFTSLSGARRREANVKRWGKAAKEALVRGSAVPALDTAGSGG